MDIGDIPRDWTGRLRVAAAFLTRLPVGPAEDTALARGAAMFPAVGAGIGLAGGAGFAVAAWIGLGPWLAAVAAVLVLVAATGALHEDGLADVADGLGVRGAREKKLEAMRDSRIGAFGAIALVLALGARIGALAELADPASAVAALVAAGALSRACVAVAMRAMPAAREDGLGAAAGAPEFGETVAALSLAGVVVLVALLPWAWLPAVAGGCGAAFAMAWLAGRAFGGRTGDVLGAVQQAAEIGVLAAAAAAL